MDENESYKWIRQMAEDAVSTTHDLQTRGGLEMVARLTEFGVRVLKVAAETEHGDNDPAVQYIADLETDLSRTTEQKHALGCGMILAVDTLKNPQHDRVSQVIEACDALFAAIYHGCG